MAFEQRLVQTQTQKLILSPQIKQYIKLLQLPLLELQNTAEQELTENPALEEDAGDGSIEQKGDKESETPEKNNEELDFQETFEKLDKLDEEFKTTLYSNHNAKLESLEELQKKHAYKESIINKAPTLTDYLLWQLKFLEFNEEQKHIAVHIIGNIDYNGYLKITVGELAEQLTMSPEIINEVVNTMQTLDPPGVGARNLQECLLIQLKQRKQDRDVVLAQTIVNEHFKLLEKRDFPQLAKTLGINEPKVNKVCDLITSLEPKPGRLFFQDEAIAIIPDASVYHSNDNDGGFDIEIHDGRVPHLRINKKYKAMLKDKSLDRKTKEYLKSKINAAFWFIKAIEQRKSTIRDITEHIVKAQSDFFERGLAFLRPLRLKDIAAQIGVHESTVSRAISDKYVNTPQGTVPYKMFFSNKMETEDGTFESQTSIMEKIKFLIGNEELKKPLSDSKIVTLLKARGIKIARRTVAKYREMLKILPSYMRRQK